MHEARPGRDVLDVLSRDVAAATRPLADDDARAARIVQGALATSGGAALTWFAVRRFLASKTVAVTVATASVAGAASWALSRGDDGKHGETIAAVDVERSHPSRISGGGDAVEPIAVHADADPPTVRAELPLPSEGAAARTGVDRSGAPTARDAVDASSHGADDDRRGARSPRASVTRDVPELTATALLERAKSARKAGRSDEATAAYLELGRRFPSSRENAVGCVALGRMQLAPDPADALSTFDRCIDEHPSGTLAEQALVGRAEALQALGRDADSRAAWRTLVERFPDTLHRDRAQTE